ncbi:MAG: sensor histidine kinase KdpD [Ignavibacteriae bacterium]|nr:MAG: sensor histidine kinase KdpD [Ignavibacteriota bacterium]
MDSSKPNADEILERIKKREIRKNKGKLKIFFGMSAGVGKTYAMLQQAKSELDNGVNVVIGYIETHDREETEALVKDIPIIPRKKILYNNIELEEMDIDAILEKGPSLVLVDELAHTNALGSRHKKRYLDVLELLDKGINVYTTINVQHLESRAGNVAQITSIVIRETVPDSILDSADEIELVDISPEELLERLEEGKVYKGEQSARAIENFFKIGNLTALREMALRLTADRVDKQLRDYMHDEKIPGPWKSGQRILVAVSSSPTSEYLIRWARSVSYSMNASWIAIYVETSKPLPDEDKARVKKALDLARELGAEIITSIDEDVVRSILKTAREENVSQILVGKPDKKRIFSFITDKEIVYRLIREGGNIDVYVVSTEKKEKKSSSLKRFLRSQSEISKYLITSSIVGFVALILYPLSEYIGYQTVAMILLLAVALLPLFFGPGPVLLAATSSAIIWNFFFIPPKFTFFIHKIEDALMFAMYFIIATVTSILTTRIRAREYAVRQREKRAVALYNLANDLSSSRSIEDVLNTTVRNIKLVFDAECALFLSDTRGLLFNTYAKGSSLRLDPKEFSVASWSFANGKKAGKFTNTLPSAECQYYPLTSPRKIFGVTAIKFSNKIDLKIDEETLLGSFISQAGVAIERELLNENSKRAMLLEESEKLYVNLFNTLSHELRTPISAIIGTANFLMERSNEKVTAHDRNIIKEIHTAGMRLNRLVENLLDMTRLESGRIKLNLKWYDIRDLVNNIIKDLSDEIEGYKLIINIPESTLPVKVDYVLLEQALKNILYNAVLYTPQGSEICIDVISNKEKFEISVSDNGPGIPDEALNSIFNKFFRVENSKPGGTGLGLSIVKGFIESHNGTICAVNLEPTGTKFIINLPIFELNNKEETK